MTAKVNQQKVDNQADNRLSSVLEEESNHHSASQRNSDSDFEIAKRIDSKSSFTAASTNRDKHRSSTDRESLVQAKDKIEEEKKEEKAGSESDYSD